MTTKGRRLTLTLALFALTLVSACTQSARGDRLATLPARPPETQPTDATAQPASTRTLEGRVVGVADGDTLTVLDAGNRQTRVRLQGIDAPESRQAFGQASKQNLSDLVYDRRVVVEYEKTDRYGRTLGKVLAGGGDVNLLQIKAGLAWHYKYYQDEQPPADRQLYADAEREARAAGRGLWADANPTPPWDFRRGKRPSDEGSAPTEGTRSNSQPRPSTTPSWTQPDGMPEPEAETVYVTRTGTKYHRSDCQYLRRSRKPISLTEAKRSYEPCSVCKPPR